MLANKKSIMLDRLIRTAGWTDVILQESGIKITTPARPSTLERPPTKTASLGRLDTIPLELLYMIFSLLDLRSLVHMILTCLRGKVVVYSSLEFRNLMKHAPKTLVALAKTRTIQYHSVSALHEAMLSTKCISCDQLGIYLHLPSCKRCCYKCLRDNQALWVIPVATAKKYFMLSTAMVNRLHTMRNLPGHYWIGMGVIRKRVNQLVSVRDAKALAIDEGITEERLEEHAEELAGKIADESYHMMRHLHASPVCLPLLSLHDVTLGQQYILIRFGA